MLSNNSLSLVLSDYKRIQHGIHLDSNPQGESLMADSKNEPSVTNVLVVSTPTSDSCTDITIRKFRL